eukprot:CAMPEP_0204591672 /NCGR_PEP_ID=MMETSP0661-20131031/50497_1 /ASSEMBLY_ACC=CAM_ASM_000606 /TAXON_ID=109239 /ORGANISM="Alexandrium margalefi, Strain AMGDE01CS-322" /LENGTH=65 /DNA_ID=CAMNT_0051601817 /DNA_START=153 /DNA_END=347 /DNA_ORIENTATION=-
MSQRSFNRAPATKSWLRGIHTRDGACAMVKRMCTAAGAHAADRHVAKQCGLEPGVEHLTDAGHDD